MRKYITLPELQLLVDTVVKTVFVYNANTNEVEYKAEYVPVVTAFYKMKFYAPDDLLTEDINTFYLDWINNKYFEAFNEIDIVQNESIDKAVAEHIEFRKAKEENLLNNALANLINVVQDGIDLFQNQFSDIKSDDIKNLISQVGKLNDGLNTNTKKVVKAVTENVVEKTNKTTKSSKNKAVPIPVSDEVKQ